MVEQEPNQVPDELSQKVLYYLARLRVRLRFYLRKLNAPVSKERRAEVQVQLRDTSEPDFDYFVMVFLSCMIATFGLLIDSVAIIIGAMLVAPLMSPILGIGLASIRADTTLLKDAAAALARGAILAILLSTIITWANDLLPFVTLQDLPGEVLSRTRPSPIDLGVALSGGLAATFALIQPQLSAALPGVAIAAALMPPLCAVGVGIALGRWDVAGGAFLLFITNAITIAASANILFYLMGFNPPRREGDRLFPRSLQISIFLTILLLAPLGWQSYQFVQEATFNREINEVVKENVEKMDAELSELNWYETGEIVDDGSGEILNFLKIEITIIVKTALLHSDSEDMQDAIAADLQQTVKLIIKQVIAAELDPAIPPTHTPTATLGPSPTFTITPIPDTATPMLTLTYTPTPTFTPTYTPTYTPTPALAMIYQVYGDGISLRAFPEGPAIGWLRKGDQVTVLYGYEIVNGWVWIEVRDAEGRVGWLPQFFTMVITETPTRTPTTTITPMTTPTPEAGTSGESIEATPSVTLPPTP